MLAYEKSLFVLDGEFDLMLDGRAYRLVKGDYALVLCGSAHGMRSSSGDGARWLEMIAPQPLSPSVGGGHVFRRRCRVAGQRRRASTRATRARATSVTTTMRSFRRPGNLQMDGYSGAGAQGIRQKFMIDRTFGSAHIAMFMVEFAPGGGGSHHTHPFEESYFFLEGAGDCTFEGRTYVVEPLTCCWTGVGAKHAIYARGDASVKFLETQTPLAARAASVPLRFRMGRDAAALPRLSEHARTRADALPRPRWNAVDDEREHDQRHADQFGRPGLFVQLNPRRADTDHRREQR